MGRLWSEDAALLFGDGDGFDCDAATAYHFNAVDERLAEQLDHVVILLLRLDAFDQDRVLVIVGDRESKGLCNAEDLFLVFLAAAVDLDK